MRVRKRSGARLCGLVLCGMLGLVVTGCGRTGISTAIQSVPPTATSSHTLGDDPCTSAADPTILTKLSTDGIPVPDGASVIEKGFASADGNGRGQSIDYETIGACTKASAPSDVRAFYAVRMPAGGGNRTRRSPIRASSARRVAVRTAGPRRSHLTSSTSHSKVSRARRTGQRSRYRSPPTSQAMATERRLLLCSGAQPHLRGS
jgi:hypothetical protein